MDPVAAGLQHNTLGFVDMKMYGIALEGSNRAGLITNGSSLGSPPAYRMTLRSDLWAEKLLAYHSMHREHTGVPVTNAELILAEYPFAEQSSGNAVVATVNVAWPVK